jgi:hypothetical protein
MKLTAVTVLLPTVSVDESQLCWGNLQSRFKTISNTPNHNCQPRTGPSCQIEKRNLRKKEGTKYQVKNPESFG